MAASEGGIEALWTILQELPPDFSVPILVVQHLSATYPSVLDRVIQTRSTLPIKWAADGERLQGGTVYIAPPNRHLTIAAPGVVALTDTDRVNWVRPSADVLFRSLARQYGSKALAVVLTGNLYDGTAGSVAIKEAGGWVLAQDEQSCQRFDMPRSVIRRGAADFVLPLESLPCAILSLVMTFGATSLFRVPCRLIPPKIDSIAGLRSLAD